jgi:hypothetical protein
MSETKSGPIDELIKERKIKKKWTII